MNEHEPPAEQLEGYRNRLESDFPEFDLSDVKILGDGWDHVALETNGIIFRLPKGTEPAQDRVAYETAALRWLKDRLPVSIPDPRYVAQDSSYFGYPKLSGNVAFDIYGHLTEEQHKKLNTDWVETAAAIHNSLSAETAADLGVPAYDPRPSVREAQQILLLSDVPVEMKDFAKRTLQRIRSIDLTRRELVFIHNDFYTKNMLLDENMRLSGLIDWSDMVVGPLEREFSVAEWGSVGSVANLARLYEDRTGIAIDIQEAQIWRHLEELVDYDVQIKARDLDGARDSVAHINRWISEGK